MPSLRQALANQGVHGCPNGLLGLNPFYKSYLGPQFVPLIRESFGFTRLSAIITALHWPASGFIEYPDHPSDDSNSWEINPDGLAHDDATWFFTALGSGLTTIPLSTDMGGL